MDQKLKKLFHRKSRSGSSLGSSSTNGRATPETPSSPTSHPGSPESGKSPKLVSSQFGLGRLEREDESRKTRQRMSQDEARPARPQAAAPSSRPQNGDIATTEAPSRSTPTQHERLKLAPQDVDLSRDLQHLTLNGNAAPRAQMTGKGYSEHVANRNIEASHRQPPARGTVRMVTTDEQLLGTTPQPEPNVANRGNVLPTPAKDTPPRGNTSQDLKVPDSSIMQNYTQNNFLVKDAPEAPSLDGIVDLSNTVDTNVDVQYAPAVVHETIHPEVHHVREEVITRDIHTHDEFHRVLPVVDVEVLPARHFIPTTDGSALMEVPETHMPGRSGNNQHWVVAETVSKLASMDTTKASFEPRRFTALEFPGTEGDDKSYMTSGGIQRTERAWVHPPKLEEGGMLSGQTVPFHFKHVSGSQ